MFERFTERARQVVVLAQQEARITNAKAIETTHLLAGVLLEQDGLAARVLEDDALRDKDGEMMVTIEKIRSFYPETEKGYVAPPQVPFTPEAKKVLEDALRETVLLGHSYIGTEHLLLALTRTVPPLVDLPVRDTVMRLLSNRHFSDDTAKERTFDEVDRATRMMKAFLEADLQSSLTLYTYSGKWQIRVNILYTKALAPSLMRKVVDAAEGERFGIEIHAEHGLTLRPVDERSVTARSAAFVIGSRS